MNPLGAVYATAARTRRSWYRHRPSSRRHLLTPVISVGNLVVGGSGKTPTVAALAAALQETGERPVILSRGYKRRDTREAVVVVSDGHTILEPVGRSGDEPQLLARTLAGIPVVIGSDRHAAGLVAEKRFEPTVLILDDGFQHFQLERDVDLLVVNEADLSARLLPFGRLREPLEAAAAADALLVTGDAQSAKRLCTALQVPRAFSLVPRYGKPVALDPAAAPAGDIAGSAVAAVAGIARPQRFFTALREQGYEVAREIVFRDHHWFSARDVERVERDARDAGAAWIVTTEKDAVRLPPVGGTWQRLPMRVTIEPDAAFAAWLAARLMAARGKAGKAGKAGRESLRKTK